MKKSNLILREILYRVYEERENFMSQKSLAESCDLSSETANRLVTKLHRFKAVRKKPQGFRITDSKKILQYWAATRDFHEDIIWSTHSALSMREIESELPKDSILTAYSGYRKKFNKKIAPYDRVYVYASQPGVKERFSESEEPGGNLVVLRKDSHLEKLSENRSAPLGQLYADLWQIGTNSADRYRQKLEEELEPKPLELLKDLTEKE